MNSEMRNIILSQHEQITHSLEVNNDVRVEGTFDAIVLAGMGGSGHPGDLMNALSVTTRPLYVHRNYGLPLNYLKQIGFTKPLVIVSSYSGNTEEALTAYQAAQSNNLTILTSASDGTLREWSKRDNTPFCHIDYLGMQPRHTLFAAFTGIVKALSNSALANDITSELTSVAEFIRETTPQLEEQARTLAQHMKDHVIVINSSDNLGFATKNFKIQTNENAKYPAFWNTVPELNHNELIGFSKLKESKNPNRFFVLIIRNPDDHPRNKARMDVMRDLYRSWGATVEEFTTQGTSLLEKLFYTTTFGLWTTYYLALEYDIDPVPVEGVESFKAKLKEVAGDL